MTSVIGMSPNNILRTLLFSDRGCYGDEECAKMLI